MHWSLFCCFLIEKVAKTWFSKFQRRSDTGNDTENVCVRPKSSPEHEKIRFLPFFRSKDQKWICFLQFCHWKLPLPRHVAKTRHRAPEICHFKCISSSGKLWNVGPGRFISIGYPLLILLKIIDFHRFRRFDHQKSAQNKDR